jgi:amino acid transporter
MRIFLAVFAILGIMLITTPEISLASFATPDVDLPDKGTIPENTGVFEGTSLVEAITIIINWILGFVGIIIFGIFLYAGFEYATSGGDSSNAEKAQKRMVNAIIGLIIIFFAFVASNAILSFIFQDSISEETLQANISSILNKN